MHCTSAQTELDLQKASLAAFNPGAADVYSVKENHLQLSSINLNVTCLIKLETRHVHMRLPNAFVIVGTKHICDNLLAAPLEKMKLFLGSQPPAASFSS